MARSEARIKTSIWSDEHFLAQPAEVQRLYFLLLGQSDLSMCGVLPLTIGRWATLAPNTTPKHIKSYLGVLVHECFVVIDDVTEEVWIRSFVKHDGVLRTPNTIVALSRDFAMIRSKPIRKALVQALPKGLRMGLMEGHGEGLPKGFTEAHRNGLGKAFMEALTHVCAPRAEPPPPPPESSSRILHIASAASTNEAPSPNGQRSVPLAASPPESNLPATRKPRTPDLLFEATVAACGINTSELTPSGRGPLNRALADLRSVGASPDDLAIRAQRFRARWPSVDLTPTALAKHWATLGAEHAPPQARAGPDRQGGIREYQRLRAGLGGEA